MILQGPKIVTIINGRPAGYISVPEFAKKCNVKTLTVNQWINRGKLKPLRIGKEYWIENSTKYPEEKPHYRSGRPKKDKEAT